MAVENYYYNEQIKKWLIQFGNIFHGIVVKTGKRSDNITEFTVPIKYATTDRVVAAISSRNTQNMLIQLPMNCFYMTNIQYAPDREHGKSVVNRHQYLEYGKTFPDELQTAYRQMPIPYNLELELSVFASNSEQMFQIIEQILLIFDPSIQIQKNDDYLDWTKITTCTLESISNLENVPLGVDRRVLQMKLNFILPIYLSFPAEIRQNYIAKIIQRVGTGDLDELNPEEPFSPPTPNPDYPCPNGNCNDSITSQGCMQNGSLTTVIEKINKFPPNDN